MQPEPAHDGGRHIGEPLIIHGVARGKEAEDKSRICSRSSGLNPMFANRYPHGIFRRPAAAHRHRARAGAQPEFIVCDEPISALDVSIQAQSSTSGRPAVPV